MKDKITKANAPFITAMAALKQEENGESRSAFIKELVNARLVIPAIIEPAPVDGKIPEKAKFSFFSVKTQKDEQFILMFSGIEEVKKWDSQGDKQLILQEFDKFKNFVLQPGSPYDGIVIDTKGSNITIRRELLAGIEQAVKPMVIKNEKVNIEQDSPLEPAQFASPGLYAALTETALRNENINALWLMEFKRKGEKMPTNVIVVDYDLGVDMKSIFNALARTANDFLATGESVGIMPSHDPAAGSAVADIMPFYLKGKHGVEINKPKK